MAREGTTKAPRVHPIPVNLDPRLEPTYTVPEAAHYLQIPAATLRSWTVGRRYPVQKGERFFEPVIVEAARGPAMLSFVNLVEAHVLAAIRGEYSVGLPAVRKAIAFLHPSCNCASFGRRHGRDPR